MRSTTRHSRPLATTMVARLHLAIAGWLLLVLVAGATAASDFPPIGVRGQSHPGKFVWFDLVTSDLAAERRFYGEVFGWQFRVIDGAPGSYTLIEDDGHEVGGMFEHAPPPDATRAARWLALISVRDPAAAVRYVEQHGGTVIAPPATLVGRGTHALLRDPEGAVFGVLKSESGDPADTPVDEGDFYWLDLFARDPLRAAEFYRGLAGFDVSLREQPPGGWRVVLAAGGYARAGIAPLPAPIRQPGWLPYVLVDEVAATLAKVRAAGGQVLLEPRAELLNGNLAVFADPGGGVLGILSWAAANAAGSAP